MQTIKSTSSIDVAHIGWAKLAYLINANYEKERDDKIHLCQTPTPA